MRKKLVILLAVLMLYTAGNTSVAAVIVPSSVSITEPDPATVKAAIKEFKNLSGKEKKMRLKQAKKEIKAFKMARKQGSDPDTNTLLLVIIAIFLPPLAVYLHQGEVNNKFWITLLLFLLGVFAVFFLSWLALLAAIIYALIVILGN